MNRQLTKIIIVTGKVQGVYFRQTTRQQALQAGLKGTVRNIFDGKSVEIITTGYEENLQPFINWCRVGPPKAIVENINVKEIPIIKFDTFEIIQ